MEDADLTYVITRLSNKSEPVFVHGKRVAKLACAIAKIMDYSDGEIKLINQSAVVHDIGKLGLPADIVNKPGTLNSEELVIIQKHPELGYSILKQITKSESVITKVALQHHERLNGSGYPFGLCAKDINPVTRIISVADVVDTMISPQVYRPALSMDEALKEIKQNSGLSYDSEVVNAALVIIEVQKFSFNL